MARPPSFDAQRQLAAALPAATLDIKWGADLVASVGGKMFCVFLLQGQPARPDAPTRSCSFKVDSERFLELTDLPGVVPAPYLARAHWVQVTHPHALRLADLDALVRRSHALVAAGLTKKLQRELGLTP